MRNEDARDAELGAFVAARSGSLLRYGYLLTGDRARAEDLVQDALVKVYLAWPRIEDTGSLDRYTRQTMTRLHVSWWRRAVNRERPVAIPELPDEADAAAPLPGAPLEERDEVWRLLATIGPRQRAVLVLRFYEGLDDAEIADVLGCAVGTVRSQASRGLAHLRDRMAARPSASTTPAARPTAPGREDPR